MMKKKRKNLIGKMLLDITPTIIGSLLRHFGKGGKTKLGVYLTGLSAILIKYAFDIDLELAASNPGALPAVAKAALSAGGLALSVGLGHDLFKKAKGIFKDIRDVL